MFAPSEATRDLVTSRFPDLSPRIEVVAHPHCGPIRSSLTPPDEIPLLEVAIVGHLEPHKGENTVLDLIRADAGPRRYHLFGTTKDSRLRAIPPHREQRLGRGRVVRHGSFLRRDLGGILRRSGVHVGLLPSVWPETFSYTLSDLVAAGLPVVIGEGGCAGRPGSRPIGSGSSATPATSVP